MTIPFQFDAVIDEFLARSRELIGLESSEDRPPRIGPATAGGRHANDATPGDRVPGDCRPGDCGPDQRIRSLFTLDEDSIRRYAHTIGDDNPLFTNPRYGRGSVHGSQIAPGPILVHCRYPADHGASRAAHGRADRATDHRAGHSTAGGAGHRAIAVGESGRGRSEAQGGRGRKNELDHGCVSE